MLNRRAFLSLIVAAAAAASSVAAAPVNSTPAERGARSAPPAEFVPQIDGPMILSIGPGGRVWAAWAYRAAGEFDVAVAFRDGDRPWSSPSYMGRRDRLDEIEPAITVDTQGTAYVAFTTRETGRVSLAVLPAGSSTWLAPMVVSGVEPAASPTIRIVRDRLIVAYRTGTSVSIAEFTIGAGSTRIFGIHDGPDGVDPLGLTPKWHDEAPPPVD